MLRDHCRIFQIRHLSCRVYRRSYPTGSWLRSPPPWPHRLFCRGYRPQAPGALLPEVAWARPARSLDPGEFGVLPAADGKAKIDIDFLAVDSGDIARRGIVQDSHQGFPANQSEIAWFDCQRRNIKIVLTWRCLQNHCL